MPNIDDSWIAETPLEMFDGPVPYEDRWLLIHTSKTTIRVTKKNYDSKFLVNTGLGAIPKCYRGNGDWIQMSLF